MVKAGQQQLREDQAVEEGAEFNLASQLTSGYTSKETTVFGEGWLRTTWGKVGWAELWRGGYNKQRRHGSILRQRN